MRENERKERRGDEKTRTTHHESEERERKIKNK